MSGIFGIFNRNGKPVEEKILNTMLDAMSYWDPDERNIWIDGSVALGHTMLWNTPESKYEHLPLYKETYVLTMDARIDNREELLEQLDLPDRPVSEIGDSEFILGAYKKWGEECSKHLLGDFSFAIWDEKKQQFYCARDHIGVKQFYYYVSNDFFLFSNDLKGVMECPLLSKNINDETVANYFVHDQLNSRTLTFFKDVVKLPQAHSLIITKSNIITNRYWKLEDSPKISLPNIQAYALKLRMLLEQVVHDRMRTDFPITSHLSGGLDSSSIAVIAARKLKSKNEKLLAFNWLHSPAEDDDTSHFEWYNSLAIAKTENIEHNYVEMTSDDIYKYMKNRDIVYGETIGFWYEYKVRKSVQSKNSRTILSGWGGDDFLTYQGRAYYSDLVCKGKIIYALKELKQQAKEKSVKSLKSIAGLLYSKLFIPFVPPKIYCYLPRNRCENIEATFSILNKTFIKVINRIYGKRANILPLQPAKTIREDMLLRWTNGGIHTRLESWAAESTVNRMAYSYPLLDKRILEFMINVPSEYLVKDRIGRYLFRLAAKDLLPEKILWMGKEQETHRVNRYLNLYVTTYKKLLDEGDLDFVESKYINKKEFLKIFKRIDRKMLFNDFLMIDATVSILLSVTLSNKKKTQT